jgi:LPS-assembly protein
LLAEERVELYGVNVDANGSLATAKGNPVALYQDEIITADELVYDRNTSIMEAKGNVSIFKGGQYHGISDYTRLNFVDDTRYSAPYYAVGSIVRFVDECCGSTRVPKRYRSLQRSGIGV